MFASAKPQNPAVAEGEEKKSSIFGGGKNTGSLFSNPISKPKGIFGSDNKPASSSSGEGGIFSKKDSSPSTGGMFTGIKQSTDSSSEKPSAFGGSKPSGEKTEGIFGLGSKPSPAASGSIFGKKEDNAGNAPSSMFGLDKKSENKEKGPGIFGTKPADKEGEVKKSTMFGVQASAIGKQQESQDKKSSEGKMSFGQPGKLFFSSNNLTLTFTLKE